MLSAILPALLLSPIFSSQRTLWLLLSALWTLAMSVFAACYLPCVFNRYHYDFDQYGLSLSSGFLYQKVRRLSIAGIQFVEISTLPIEHMLGLCSLSVYAMGGRLTIAGLTPKTAHRIKAALLPVSKKESADE